MAESLQPTAPRTMLDYARAYAARGWSVVPVRPGEKIPAVPWAQFQHRRASDQELCDWFGDGRMGIGIVTGVISGLFVADFDGEDGHQTLDKLAGHITGPTSLTGGGGAHVLLRHPGVRIPTRKGLAPGMDIRGDGGFIVAPPSVHPSGTSYQWDVDNHPDDVAILDAPKWFIERITADAPPGPAHAAEVTRGAGPLGLDIGHITDGRETYMRNTILAVCRDLRDKLGRLPDAAELEAAAWPQYAAKVDFSRPGRGLHEFRAKVAYTLARAAKGAVRGLEGGAGPFDAPSGGMGSEAPKAPLPLVFFEDVAPNLDATDFVEDLLTEGSTSVVYGESNCGKTFFMTDLALHVATGRQWNGRQIEAGGVIYCALEGGHGIGNRVAAFKQRHDLAGVTLPFAIIPVSLNLLDPEADTTRLIETIAYAAEHMGRPVKLVVIDTLSRALAGGNENAPDDMGALVTSDAKIRQATGAHVAWVHHSGKDSARGARGHSLLRAATDTEIEIAREDKDSPSVATVKKQRDLEISGEWTFTLHTVTLGKNRRGKDVRSCVVEYEAAEDAAEAAPQPARTKLTGQAKRAHEILLSLVLENGQPGFGVPQGQHSVPEDWWRDRFYQGAMPGATADAKQKAFKRASALLIEFHKVGMKGGRVWAL